VETREPAKFHLRCVLALNSQSQYVPGGGLGSGNLQCACVLAPALRQAVRSAEMRGNKTASQKGQPLLVDTDSPRSDNLPCCGIKNPSHPGRCEKLRWLKENAEFGLRAKTLLAPDGQPCGYIEYTPGEFAWRGVDARGYMFIHCVWVHAKQYQRKGWGRWMVQACLEDAKKEGKSGVAVMVRGGPWMTDRRLFLANGFESVDIAPPDCELLVRKFDKGAANPSFKGDWDRKLRRFRHGLTLIRSSQCPYIPKFTAEIIETAKKEYDVELNEVDLRSPDDAQNAPTPYAVFSLIYEGRLLADHQISRTRFRNIMNKLKKQRLPPW